MNPLFTTIRLYSGKLLGSKWTGWGFFAALSLIVAGWMEYSRVKSKLNACLAQKPTPTETYYANILKEKNNDALDSRIEDLDSTTDNACLDSVYDPDKAARDRIVRSAQESDERNEELDQVGAGAGDSSGELQHRDSES